MTDSPRTVRVVIRGRVQGVGYRDWTHGRDRLLGLDGWVRNRDDGSVEALVSGPTKAVEAFVASAMKGPPAARIGHVDLHNSEPPAEKGFKRLASA